MKTYLSLAMLALSPFTGPAAFAEAYQVYGVKSDYPMHDSDARYRDVYVNLGQNQGLKKGSVLEAWRTLTTVDELNQRVGKNIKFKVAKLKVIHADDDVSVARVQSFEGAESTPQGGYGDVMVGDSVEMARK